MNAKIITVWGANGSGKTTVSVNLGAALADRDFTVGILSSKLYYGEIQSFFGKRVETERGTYKAISNGCNTKNMFEATNHPNLFFLSPPTSFDGMLLSSISGDTIRELIEDSCIRFDFILIDGSEELNKGGQTLVKKFENWSKEPMVIASVYLKIIFPIPSRQQSRRFMARVL